MIILSSEHSKSCVDYLGARRTVNGTARANHIAAIARGYEPKVKQWLMKYGVKWTPNLGQ